MAGWLACACAVKSGRLATLRCLCGLQESVDMPLPLFAWGRTLVLMGTVDGAGASFAKATCCQPCMGFKNFCRSRGIFQHLSNCRVPRVGGWHHQHPRQQRWCGMEDHCGSTKECIPLKKHPGLKTIGWPGS